MPSSVARVADRWMVRLAARRICGSRSFQERRASLPGFTPEVLEAFAFAFWDPRFRRKASFGSIFKKLKKLADIFRKVPRLWAQFQKVVGVENLADLPGAIREFSKKGQTVLKAVVGKLFDTWPLKIYTLEKSKLFSVSAILDRLMKKHPGFSRWIDSKVKPKIDQLDAWLKERAPTLSKVFLLAVFFFIWWNVQEFEWDLHSLTEIFTGNITLADLLANLPSAGIGALLNVLGFGSFSFLPAAFVARLAWLLSHRYLSWTGKGFQFDTERLSSDFGMSVQELEAEGA